MYGQANVDDLEVFRRFRASLLKFSQAANQTLANADSQIARTHLWLENEQITFWQSQIRKRHEAVIQAKDAVRQKKLYRDASGRTPSAVEEEKHLSRCLAALEHAQQKLEVTKRWIPRLEHAAGLYRGGVARLHATICGDIPSAVALLDRLAMTLEEYVQIAAPAVPEISIDPLTLEASMSRGGDSKEQKPAAPSAAPAPNQETPHGPHGN
jgi:hypothetical protein